MTDQEKADLTAIAVHSLVFTLEVRLGRAPYQVSWEGPDLVIRGTGGGGEAGNGKRLCGG